MCGYAQPVSGAVENFPNLKGLEDEAEELEELSKLALSPVGVYSTQVSPIPNDPNTERAEEALDLIAAAAELSVTDHGTDEPHTVAGVASAPPTPAPEPSVPASTKSNGRRTSHSWRGLKKQLSRVDLKLKNTFNATPAKKASTFYGGEQPENDETTAGNLPQIITETDGGGGGQEQRTDGGGGQPSGDQSSASATATRPTELKLFDRDGKPIKPPRSSKEQQQQHRKRTSLDKQGNLTAGAASRDARLLSVPNIKYIQRDPKHNRSNNQAFISLAKKLSKLIRKKNPHTLDQKS